MTTGTMHGTQKAAVLLIQMGREHAAKVLAELGEQEVEAITAEIVRLQSVEPDLVDGVVDEFHELLSARRFAGQGGLGFAQEMLASGLGAERAGEIMSRLSATLADMPFEFLRRADPRQVLTFLQDEHPQVVALVLAHMPAGQAAVVLGGLSSVLQADVAHRIAVMDRTSPDIIRQVEATLERKFSSVIGPGELSTVGGLQPLVEIINRSDRATERLILEGLEGRDPALAEEVRSQMFVFEDITTLDDRSIQLVLRQVEAADLAIALKGVRADVQEKITANLSERAAETLVEEIEIMGPVKLRTVEESQAKIVQVIRALEESGQITVQRGSDDEYVT